MKTAGVILGAGLGSRLRPFTDALAKPLVPVLDRPVIAYTMATMAAAGVEEIFVNLHHRADQMRAALMRGDSAVPVTTRLEPTLSGPAGALRVFADDLAPYDAVVVASGDVLIEADLTGLLNRHRTGGASLTVAVTRQQRGRNFGVLDIADDGRITRAREKPPVPDEEWHWVSAGIYCLSPSLIRDFPATGTYDYAADLVPDLLARGERVTTWPLPGAWEDIGTPAALRRANLRAAQGRIHVGEGCEIGVGVELHAPLVIGAGARIGAHSWLQDCVVLPGSVVPAHTVLVGALVAPRVTDSTPETAG
ncbi:sugar phosphate nucleotidyltransferase [Streptomyces naphthomycinicus]|uniref:sugar phosphate nucleotidyltransferase n=1 Tax=Streptomyces naphthomycinicus TaxID=2872625 RepID=UPI001CEC006C|nr:NDP-sugar synthase [Streptomyces sp. TML10]